MRNTGPYSLDSFCKTAEKQRISAFTCVKSVKLADNKEENEREWFCKTLIINYTHLFRG